MAYRGIIWAFARGAAWAAAYAFVLNAMLATSLLAATPGAGVLDDVQSTLTIAEDGTVSGRGGCNGFGGMATISGEKLSFGPLAGTLMVCPEAVMDQERKFHDALAATAAFRLDAAERKLVLLDAAGTELVRFTAD